MVDEKWRESMSASPRFSASVALSITLRVLFVCAVSHVGLSSNTDSAISMLIAVRIVGLYIC